MIEVNFSVKWFWGYFQERHLLTLGNLRYRINFKKQEIDLKPIEVGVNDKAAYML